MMTPPRIRPAPPPMPNVAEIRPMLLGDPLARELVADDPEAEREDAAAGALQDAAEDDDLEAGAERGDDGAGGEQPERDDEAAALAEHVAEAAEDRRADRGGEQIAGDRPGDAAGVGVQRLGQLGQGGDQRRLREREGERGEREDEEAAHRVGAGVRHRDQASEPDSRVRFAVRLPFPAGSGRVRPRLECTTASTPRTRHRTPPPSGRPPRRRRCRPRSPCSARSATAPSGGCRPRDARGVGGAARPRDQRRARRRRADQPHLPALLEGPGELRHDGQGLRDEDGDAAEGRARSRASTASDLFEVNKRVPWHGYPPPEESRRRRRRSLTRCGWGLRR